MISLRVGTPASGMSDRFDLSTILRSASLNPEQTLACSIVQLAFNDFKIDVNYSQDNMDFLTGQTEISRFWFDVAGLEPFTSKQIWLGVL